MTEGTEEQMILAEAEQPKRKRGRPRKNPLPEATKGDDVKKTVAKKALVPEHYFQDIQGWCKFYLFYARMVEQAEDGATFVEVGSWKGQSAAYMGVEILKSGKKIAFHCVDHFKGADEAAHQHDPDLGRIEQIFAENLKPCVDAGLDLTVVKADSAKAAEKYKDGTLDFVWLDAGHDYVTVRRDIEAWLPKVKVGGIIGGDDYPMNGVGEAVNEKLGAAIKTEQHDGWTYWWMPIHSE